jgi:hypothetical protein
LAIAPSYEAVCANALRMSRECACVGERWSLRKLGEHRRVIVRVDDHADVRPVLRRRAHHRRPPMSMFSIASSSVQPAWRRSRETDTG